MVFVTARDSGSLLTQNAGSWVAFYVVSSSSPLVTANWAIRDRNGTARQSSQFNALVIKKLSDSIEHRNGPGFVACFYISKTSARDQRLTSTQRRPLISSSSSEKPRSFNRFRFSLRR